VRGWRKSGSSNNWGSILILSLESTHPRGRITGKFADLPSGEEVDLEVAIAGRILVRRVFGKLAFFSKRNRHFSSTWIRKNPVRYGRIAIQMLSTTSSN